VELAFAAMATVCDERLVGARVIGGEVLLTEAARRRFFVFPHRVLPVAA